MNFMDIGSNDAVISEQTLKINKPYQPIYDPPNSRKLYNTMNKFPSPNKHNKIRRIQDNPQNLFVQGKSFPLNPPMAAFPAMNPVMSPEAKNIQIEVEDPIPSLKKKESEDSDQDMQPEIQDHVDLSKINIEEQKQLLANYQKDKQEIQNQETILDNKGNKVKQTITYSHKTRLNRKSKHKFDKIQNSFGFNGLNNHYNNVQQEGNGDLVFNANIQNDSNMQPQSLLDQSQALNNENIQFLKWRDDQSVLNSDFNEKQDINEQIQNNFKINVVIEEPSEKGKFKIFYQDLF